MARIHAHTHGKSHSTRPTSKDVPPWLTESQEKVSSLIIGLAKPILGRAIADVLVDNDIIRDMPEDLEHLVMKALGLQKHLRTHNSDHRNVRSLELIESKIHRLSKYYKKIGKIKKNWKYAAVIAQLE
jgi:small subunit ribosomal protein S15